MSLRLCGLLKEYHFLDICTLIYFCLISFCRARAGLQKNDQSGHCAKNAQGQLNSPLRVILFGNFHADTTQLVTHGCPPIAYSRNCPMSDKLCSVYNNPWYLVEDVTESCSQLCAGCHFVVRPLHCDIRNMPFCRMIVLKNLLARLGFAGKCSSFISIGALGAEGHDHPQPRLRNVFVTSTPPRHGDWGTM